MFRFPMLVQCIVMHFLSVCLSVRYSAHAPY